MLSKLHKLGNLPYFLFRVHYRALILSSCVSFSLHAMDKEEKLFQSPITPPPLRTIHIVSPEAVELTQRLRLMALSYPPIAQPTPHIDSLKAFKLAKEYFGLSKKYEHLLYAAALGGAKIELLEESQRVLKGMFSYLDILRGNFCRSFRSEEDEKELEDSFYEANYRVGQNYLMLLIPAVLAKNLPVLQNYVTEIKNIKTAIAGNSKYRKLLQQQIETAQDLIPPIKPLFNPELSAQNQQFSGKLSRKIEQKKTINFHQKISTLVSQQFSENSLKESFDPYFHFSTNKILTEALSLSSQKILGKVYIQKLQKLTEDYVSLENEGMQFRAKLLCLEAPPDLANLKTKDLIDVYTFFCQRYTLPHKNPLQLLEHIILIFIHGNKLEEAMIRTEVLKTLLLNEGPLTDAFISFRASVMALNGDTDEWRMILDNKRKAKEQKKVEVHQQKVTLIKKSLEETQKNQELLEVKKDFPQKLVRVEEKSPISFLPLNASGYISIPTENYKSEVLPPREKTKTHKPPQNPTMEDETSGTTKSPIQDPILTPHPPIKTYPLSKRAFKTYTKIRTGDWKFPRLDLYNLFEKLGCRVDVSQGKGDHGKVSFPLNMTIENTEGLVAVIPEFVREGTFNTVPTLTVPNWDEKWDGRVPPYMTKSILKALDYLGATDETVHKNKMH